MTFRRTGSVFAALLGAAALIQRAAGEGYPSTRPSTEPSVEHAAAAGAVEKLVIAPDVQKLLDQVRDAYHDLKSLDLAGAMAGDIHIGEEKQTPHADFTAQYLAPSKFRHENKDGLVLGSTGDEWYVLLLKRNIYLKTAGPKGKPDLSNPEGQAQEMLQQQDPGLLLAVTSDAEAAMLADATSVTAAGDVTVGEMKCPAVKIDSASGDATIAFDPATHLVRRVVMDLTKELEESGQKEVKAATLTFDYTKVTADSPDVADAKFAFVPPAGAKEAPDEQPEATTLVGQPAPAFKLTGMDGATHSLDELKGSVVVLDFWATWCGPCRASLPHLNDLYKKESPNGLKVFALDQGEDKDTVQKFITETKYSFPVLLDTESVAGGAYKVNGIPQTVVIGKDGRVKKVFVGFDPGGERRLQKAVAEAMAEGAK